MHISTMRKGPERGDILADGTTLEKLKVVFEAQYAKYKQDMAQVQNATKRVSKEVEAEKAKINKQFGAVSTDKARREIEKLQDKLAKQREAVAAQESVLQKLHNQYRDLMEGITKDPTESSLERQLRAAQKELAKMDGQIQPLYRKLEAFRGMKNHAYEQNTAQNQIDALLPRYRELKDCVADLNRKLAEVQMSPESTTTAKQLQMQIALANDKLERLRDTAAETQLQLGQTLDSPKSSLKEKINGIISKVRQLGSNSKKSSSEMHSGFSKVSDGINRFKKRLTRMAASVLVFNVFNKGLNACRDTLTQSLQANEQFNHSLTSIKTNLKTAFMPIYEAILPGINALMDKLAALSEYLAVFTASIFGKTYKASREAAEGLADATDAANGYNKALGLASFDKLNNLTTSSSGTGSSVVAEEVVNESAMTAAGKFRELLEKLTEGTEAFRQALKKLWDGGLSKLAGFTWQGLKDFWDNFLKPLGKWAFGTEDKGLTRLVNILNDDLNNVPWDEINENLSDFWTAAEPYAEEFGEGLIDFLEDCGDVSTDALVWLFGDDGIMPKVTDWLNENDPEEARKWGYNLGVLAATIAGFSVASKIASAVRNANNLLSALGGLKGLGKIAICVAVAYEGFEIGKEVGKLIHPEDTELYDTFHWTGGGGFFDEISKDWGTAFDGLCTMATDFKNNPAIALLTSTVAGPVPTIIGNFNKAKDGLSEVKDNFDKYAPLIEEKWSGIWDNASTKFGDWKDSIFEKLEDTEFGAWAEDIKEIFSTLCSDIKDGTDLPEAFKTAFANAANAAREIFNKLIDHLNEKLKIEWEAVEIAGKEIIPAGSIQLFTIPHIPALAKGGIATGRTLAELGEAGREAILPLENNTGWMQTLCNMLAKTIAQTIYGKGSNGSSISVYLQGEAGKFFKVIREEDRKYYKRTGHSAFDYAK